MFHLNSFSCAVHLIVVILLLPCTSRYILFSRAIRLCRVSPLPPCCGRNWWMLVFSVSDSNCWRLCNGVGNLDNKWLGWVQLLACGIEAYDQDTTELQNVNLCGFLLQPVLYTPFLLVRDVSFSNSVGSPAQGCYPASLFRSPPDSALSLVKVVCCFCAVIHFDNSFLFWYFLVRWTAVGLMVLYLNCKRQLSLCY